MASSKSLYYKIYHVLSIANGREVADKGNDLIEVLISENSSIFFTYQFNDVSKENELKLSRKVIENIVNLCKTHLNLLTNENQLSRAGKSAITKDKFNNTLAHQISFFFKNHDYDFKSINNVIRDSFVNGLSSEQLPTSKLLWEKTECPINKHLFSIMLTLLGNCGFAISSQKKVYLKIQLTNS